MSMAQLRQARHALITQCLLAYRHPLYQVLALGTPPHETLPDATDGAVDLKAVFERIWEVLS
jgi:hypothetical protein